MLYPWHQTQWQNTRRLIDSGQLPHALLLFGNSGLGKADFAHELAAAVLCQQPDAEHRACGHCASCQLLSAGTHPDLYSLKPVEKKNTTSKKPALRIRIEDIRSLCDSLNQTSQFSGYRVAIIDQAEQMTLEAANSLLKTLEEPGAQVLILLVSSRPNRLPVTIRSRCQRLRFAMPDEQTALTWLQQNIEKGAETSAEALQQALKYAHGSPLGALKQLEESESYQLIAEAMTAGMSGRDALAYATKLAQLDKVQTLEVMQTWLSDLSRLSSCGADAEITNSRYRHQLQARAEKVNRQRLFRFYDQLNFNLSHSAIAVNEQLLWENLLLSWEQL